MEDDRNLKGERLIQAEKALTSFVTACIVLFVTTLLFLPLGALPAPIQRFGALVLLAAISACFFWMVRSFNVWRVRRDDKYARMAYDEFDEIERRFDELNKAP